jgi:hypothetical protein
MFSYFYDGRVSLDPIDRCAEFASVPVEQNKLIAAFEP